MVLVPPPHRDLNLEEDTIELLASMEARIRMNCVLYGHVWCDDVPGIDGIVCVRCAAIKGERMADVPNGDDYIVRMPPAREYTVRARIEREKGTPCFAGLEDEVRDAMEICGCGLVKELCCWDELSDEVWKKLWAFEDLVDQSEPPLSWPEKYWTYDDWRDWLMGR